MEEKLNILRDKIKPKMDELNIIISDISYVLEHKNYFLRITLDKVNGIDLDTIVMASEIINPIVDELDLFEDSYILDILSKEGSVNNG